MALMERISQLSQCNDDSTCQLHVTAASMTATLMATVRWMRSGRAVRAVSVVAASLCTCDTHTHPPHWSDIRIKKLLDSLPGKIKPRFRSKEPKNVWKAAMAIQNRLLISHGPAVLNLTQSSVMPRRMLLAITLPHGHRRTRAGLSFHGLLLIDIAMQTCNIILIANLK